MTLNLSPFFRFSAVVLLGISILFLGACRKDFATTASHGDLAFSTDTLFLDTVFTSTSSSTYRFTVYNRSDNDVHIPSIRLAQGTSSYYRLNIDGIPGKTFQNIELLAKDSLFVFVEVTADIKSLSKTKKQFLYTEAIVFDQGPYQQKVALVTLIQDAVFLYPKKFQNGTTESLLLGIDAETGEEIRISGFFLADTLLHFTAKKPYVIYGYAAVPKGKTLEIDAGARLHFHANSGLIVANKASLHINGAVSKDPDKLENEVIFEGDRLEPRFKNVPGQWGHIWLTAGSTDNRINHATIKNATIGILMDSNDGTNSPTLRLKNTQIYNASQIGLWAKTGHIYGENVVINNSGLSSLYLSLGGTYNFVHCTFTNYWNAGFRNYPAVLIGNELKTANGVQALVAANFTNCIIYGNAQTELLFARAENSTFNYSFKNCLIRFEDVDGNFSAMPMYDFSDATHYQEIILNKAPKFLAPQENKLIIDHSSAGNNLAIPLLILEDILGKTRSQTPDIGAYESVDFPEDK